MTAFHQTETTCPVVAITGRSGSGKSTVSAHYAALGYTVLDADEAARQVTATGSPCLTQLTQTFGADILDANGNLRRKELAVRAFSTQDGTTKLIQITHPAIVAILLEGVEAAKNAGEKLVFVDGAVIVGAAFEAYCQSILVVTAPQDASVARIVHRDEISQEAAVARLRAQMPQAELEAVADYILHNDTTVDALYTQADFVLGQLQKGKLKAKL